MKRARLVAAFSVLCLAPRAEAQTIAVRAGVTQSADTNTPGF